MDKTKVILDTIKNVCDMLTNNAETISSGIAESFCDWCESGDIFYNGYENYTEEEKKYACEIMLSVSKNVDTLSQQFYEIFEKINNEKG